MTTPQASFKGQWLTPADPAFAAATEANLWNELRPNRKPDVIAKVADVEDVIYAVKYAKEHRLRVCVRGGGHNWACPSLRQGGLLLDLAALNKVISIDKENRRAVLEPIISNRQLQAILKPYDLAYPSGHCPTVKLSGYLLSGGMSWNHGVWGPGTGSIEAIEMVTADGKLITASEHENQDYFFAARGAGPGFFAIAVRYHLRLYKLPTNIACSSYFFPLEDAPAIAKWLGPKADELTPNVELSLFMVTATGDLAKHGKVALVTATVFANSKEEAEAALRPLESYPQMSRCLSKTFAQPSDFEGIFDLSEALWPRPMRCLVDAMLYNEPLVDLVTSTVDHFGKCPSDKTVYMYAVYTGGSAPALPKDTAFSMTGKLYGGPWTMWDGPENDQANIDWHKELLELLLPRVHGHYISESSTQLYPEFIEKSFLHPNFARLETLKAKYDPTDLFFGF
ncbi:MAG TPA: FAD-binding oxidoreductase [Fimbriimonas sp.]|nr:FAD-binding oxidoreductase [Fimbriimonas sp.]